VRQPSVSLALVAAIIGMSGCAVGRENLAKRLHAESPRVQVEAIAEVVRTDDRTYVPDLIDLLESEDEAVRFTAAAALHRLTGQDFGTQFTRTDEERAIRVAQWHQWWRAQGLPRAQQGGRPSAPGAGQGPAQGPADGAGAAASRRP